MFTSTLSHFKPNWTLSVLPISPRYDILINPDELIYKQRICLPLFGLSQDQYLLIPTHFAESHFIC